MRFDGSTYDPNYDGERLSTQYMRVFALMADNQWRTLAEITPVAGGTEAAVSARLRDCRKARFGSHLVERRRRGEPGDGLWEYRLTVRRGEAAA